MPRIFMADKAGVEWSVDEDAMYALVRANISANLIKDRTKIERETHVIGPDILSVSTDWDGYRKKLDEDSQTWWQDTRLRLKNLSGEVVFRDLVLLRADTATKTDEVEKMKRTAQQQTMHNIEDSVGRGKVALEAAKLVRDASALTLVTVATMGTGTAVAAGGATILTGGQAMAVLAGGSLLKGTAKYQDDGKVGTAVMEAGSTFVVGALGVAGGAAETAKLGGKWVLIGVGSTLDAGFEGMKAVMDGESAKTAMVRAGVRLGVDLAAAGIPLDKLSIAGKIRANTAVAVAADKGIGQISLSPNPPPAKGAVTAAAGPPGIPDEVYVRQKVLTKVG